MPRHLTCNPFFVGFAVTLVQTSSLRPRVLLLRVFLTAVLRLLISRSTSSLLTNDSIRMPAKIRAPNLAF
jgi:hypothetical protein